MRPARGRRPRTSARSWIARSVAGSIPTTVTGTGIAPRGPTSVEAEDRSGARGLGATDGDARRRARSSRRSRRRGRSRRTTDAQVGTADQVGGPCGRPPRRCPALVASPANSTATPRATPEHREDRAERPRREAAPGELRPRHRCTAYRPSWASRPMRGAASCSSRRPRSIVVADPPVADDEDPVRDRRPPSRRG